MFTVDGVVNCPCHGIKATTSYEYLTLNSTALCTPMSTSNAKDMVGNDVPDVGDDNRAKIIATRLLQLCDQFDQEYFQPATKSSSMILLVWRFFF